jgi:hypothetical protein
MARLPGNEALDPPNALVFCQFSSQFDVAGVRSFRNLGKAGGARARLTNGDGSTASTMASQLVGRKGISFDGTTDYITAAAPSGLYTVTWFNGVSVTHEHVLTQWTKFTTAGQYSGKLIALVVNPWVLCPTQKTMLERKLKREANLP